MRNALQRCPCLILLLFLLSQARIAEAQAMEPVPVCPGPPGLRNGGIERRIEWFLKRHPDKNITTLAWLFQRRGSSNEWVAGRMWHGSAPVLTTRLAPVGPVAAF